MLFRKHIEPHCIYCTRSIKLSDREVACRHHGVMPGGESCGKFQYDPLKRVPPPPVQLRGGYSPDDFKLG